MAKNHAPAFSARKCQRGYKVFFHGYPGFQCNADSNTQKVAQKSEVLEGLGGDLLELERLFEPLVGRRGGHLADLPDQAQAKPPEGHPDDHQEDPEDPLVGPLVDLLAGLQESFQDRRHALVQITRERQTSSRWLCYSLS